MVMFIADHQYPGGTTHGLKSVLQTFNCGPGSAYVKFNLVINTRNFAHVTVGDLEKILAPLSNDFDARGDNDNSIDKPRINEIFCDNAGRDGLACARSSV